MVHALKLRTRLGIEESEKEQCSFSKDILGFKILSIVFRREKQRSHEVEVAERAILGNQLSPTSPNYFYASSEVLLGFVLFDFDLSALRSVTDRGWLLSIQDALGLRYDVVGFKAGGIRVQMTLVVVSATCL